MSVASNVYVWEGGFMTKQNFFNLVLVWSQSLACKSINTRRSSYGLRKPGIALLMQQQVVLFALEKRCCLGGAAA